MSLTKLLKAPIKLFKKDVITFLIIRRYDLGILNEMLQYIAMKPSASIAVLRRKVWHLLDLPDYCEEIIILKTHNNIQIPLTELRRGNSPHSPYIMEVWLPENAPGQYVSSGMYNNMLTMGKNNATKTLLPTDKNFVENNGTRENNLNRCTADYVMSTDTIAQIKHRVSNSVVYPNYKTKTELSCKSKTSMFRLHGKRSQDNFANILMKIQSDLSALTSKICLLENKIVN